MSIETILDYLFKKKVIINCDHNPYLLRWFVVRTRHFGLFIHKFIRSDEDRALHDHPWNFIVIPIWRGYIEHSDRITYDDDFGNRVEVRELIVKRRVWPIIGTRARLATYRHRVELLTCDYSKPLDIETDCPVCHGTCYKPSWSIFIRFTKFRDWGFWTPNGFVQWSQFWKDNKCE